MVVWWELEILTLRITVLSRGHYKTSKPCDANQLPSWQNFQSVPLIHSRFLYTDMSVTTKSRHDNKGLFHYNFMSTENIESLEGISTENMEECLKFSS